MKLSHEYESNETIFNQEHFEKIFGNTPGSLKNHVIFSDMDGTLLPSSKNNLPPGVTQALSHFRSLGGKCVIVTGRNSHSVRSSIDPDSPIDYLLFSNGAGVMEWATKQVIHSHTLSPKHSLLASSFFLTLGIEYFAHHPVPENNQFHYTPPISSDSQDLFSLSRSSSLDFRNRVKLLLSRSNRSAAFPDVALASDIPISEMEHALGRYMNSHEELQNGTCQLIGIVSKDFFLPETMDDLVISAAPASNIDEFSHRFRRLFTAYMKNRLQIDEPVTCTEDLGYSVVFCTSPFDHQSIWIEILPAHVHKGATAKAFLENHLNFTPKLKENVANGLEEKLDQCHVKILGIGNDYNDTTLLDFAHKYGNAYLVENAPQPMKEIYKSKYTIVPSCEREGFCHALEHWVDIYPPKDE